VNRDFAPIAYYFDVILWSTQFNSSYSSWFRAWAHVSFRWMLGAAVMVLSLVWLPLAVLPGSEGRARSAAAFCTVTTGFTCMVLQILLLFAFQSIYGYVYYQLAILIGLFMGGMAFGSWLGMRRSEGRDRASCFRMAAAQTLLALSAPALIFGVGEVASASGNATSWMAAQFVFPAFAVAAGVLGGYPFPVATEVYFHAREARLGMGALYAADLLGGCAGALLVSTYLIPVLGFWRTAWLSGAINLMPALLALRVSPHGERPGF
jgi:spermidine synthase